MLGHKRIPSREGGIEIVVEELATRMVTLGHKVTCYNRSGHHVSGKDFDGGKRKAYKGVRLKSVLTLDSPEAEKVRAKVRCCDRDCWMIGSVSPAMHKYIWKPAFWVIQHKFLRFFKKKKYSINKTESISFKNKPFYPVSPAAAE